MANIDDKYIKIQGWMVNQLELTGSELMIYAYIYSFQFKELLSKEEKKAVPTEISIRAFMDWTRLKKRAVIYTLQSLQDKGLIKSNSKPGAMSTYEIVRKSISKAQGKRGGAIDCTSVKNAPVQKIAPGGATDCTGSGATDCTGVVQKNAQSGATDCTTYTTTTKTTKKTTKTTARVARDDASASLSSTDTEDRYEDLSKTEIAFFEKQALKKLGETDETTGQKLYLTKDPRDQFPKAFLFMTAKDTSQFTDTEFELFKMVSMYTAFGPARPLPTVSEEDAKYVPPASEIGQEAHDAQQALVDWLFEGGPSPSSYAHDAPLQSRRQK